MTIFGNLNENGEIENKLKIDLKSMPSSDPIAFSYGIHSGQNAVKKKNADKNYVINHGSKFSDLDQEYLRGFLFGYKGILIPEGTKIKKGTEQTYFHLDKNLIK